MKVCPVCFREYSDTTTLCSVDAAVLRNPDDPGERHDLQLAQG